MHDRQMTEDMIEDEGLMVSEYISIKVDEFRKKYLKSPQAIVLTRTALETVKEELGIHEDDDVNRFKGIIVFIKDEQVVDV